MNITGFSPAVEYLWTKQQLLGIQHTWGVASPMTPTNGNALYINFPPTAEFPLATVENTEMIGTYGDKLYLCQLWRKDDD